MYFYNFLRVFKIWPDKFLNQFFKKEEIISFYSLKKYYMIGVNQLEREMYQEDNDAHYLDKIEESIKNEILKMIDNDGKELQKKKHRDGVMITKPKIDKYTIAKNVSFEYTYKEIPCRSIILGNIPEGTTQNNIKYILSEFGDYESCDWDHLKEGRITIRFYNLLDAMMMRLSTIYIQYRSVIMSFGNELPVIDKKHPPNNGTIVIFNLPESATDYEIIQAFMKYGDIKDIRRTPNKNTQRFVEFFDSRAAFKAKKEMKKRKLMINGKCCQVNIEFSLPGNYRINHEKYYRNNVPTIQRRETKAN